MDDVGVPLFLETNQRSTFMVAFGHLFVYRVYDDVPLGDAGASWDGETPGILLVDLITAWHVYVYYV